MTAGTCLNSSESALKKKKKKLCTCIHCEFGWCIYGHCYSTLGCPLASERSVRAVDDKLCNSLENKT